MVDLIFSPSFGNKPSSLVGRNSIMKELCDSLNSLPGSRERVRLIIGQRGMGKTVLLLELADYARNNGYIVASPTVVSSDMLERIIEKLERECSKYLPKEKAKITGGSVGFLGFSAGIQTEYKEQAKRSFADRLETICEKIGEEKRGVLILIDEVQSSSEELKKLIIAYQEMVGMKLNIALVLAGLPSSISQTLNQHVLTFLNRASKLTLEPIAIGEIELYYQKCFKKLGIMLTDEMVVSAAKFTEGSPYLMQLVGHYLTVSSSSDKALSEKEFNNALDIAKKEFVRDICETTIAPLSEKDVEFIKAMAQDKDGSSMKDISTRLGVDSSYANRYRTRLIQADIIRQKRRGFVEFAVPYLRDYLYENKVD